MTPYTFTRILSRLTRRAHELEVFLSAASQGEYPEAKAAAEAITRAVEECRTLHTVIAVSALIDIQFSQKSQEPSHEK